MATTDEATIGLFLGSLGDSSSNEAALRVVAQAAARLSMPVALITGLAEVPAFIPQQTDNPPASVANIRNQLDAVDAVIFAVPEYAGGMAGSTKNALDWLVGAATLYRKPVAVISVGTTGGEHTLAQMVLTLSWQGAWTFATLGIASPRSKMKDGEFADPSTISELEAVLAAVAAAPSLAATDRVSRLTRTLGPYNIDVARLGDLSG